MDAGIQIDTNGLAVVESPPPFCWNLDQNFTLKPVVPLTLYLSAKDKVK
jgi:hypothetical protein